MKKTILLSAILATTIKFDEKAQKKINEISDDLFLTLEEIGVIQ